MRWQAKEKKDQGASSYNLPVETPANVDDTQDYMILEENTHPSSEEREMKPSEVLRRFLNKYQSRSTRDLTVRTNTRPEMTSDAQHYTLATPL